MFITPSHKEKIKNFFKVMERYVEIIKRLKGEEKEQFLSDPFLQFAAERALHIALECVTDVGNLLIDTLIMRDPSSYEDIIQILAEEDVIEKEFASHFLEVVRYRRCLVHDYQKIDPETVYRLIQNHSTDFDQLKDSVYTYVGMQ